MTAIVYTDASYSNSKLIAACGYCVLFDGVMVKHEVLLYENILTTLQAETISIIQGLLHSFMLKGITQINVHTDCLIIVEALNS